ncbi:helix-turn-helix domain-containing protein [Scytonema sp. PRP1]|uniref:helix-turn-helix domain-containing protein n=1 Tax=Scytonema sp. PRP1 TaxID=3120513 RepID=UPI002FCF3635
MTFDFPVRVACPKGLGVTYPTINRWENGHTKPSPLAMQKIEEMLKHRDLYSQNLNFQENKQFYS